MEAILGEKPLLLADNTYVPQFLITEAVRDDLRIILSAHIGVRMGEEAKLPDIKERIWQKLREVFESRGTHIHPHGETQPRTCSFKDIRIEENNPCFVQQITHFLLDPNPPK